MENKPTDKGEWVSVEDGLPEVSKTNRYFSDTVMLLVGKRKYKGQYNFNRNHFSKYGFHTENYIFNEGAVTHWKPLPSPPNK